MTERGFSEIPTGAEFSGAAMAERDFSVPLGEEYSDVPIASTSASASASVPATARSVTRSAERQALYTDEKVSTDPDVCGDLMIGASRRPVLDERDEGHRLDRKERENFAYVLYLVLGFIGIGATVLLALGIIWAGQECSEPLATFVIVSGVSLIGLIPLVLWYSSFTKRRFIKANVLESSKAMKIMGTVGCLCGVFALVWFIVGNVWTWNTDKVRCDKQLYFLAKWYIIFGWITFLMAMLLNFFIHCMLIGVDECHPSNIFAKMRGDSQRVKV